MFEDNIEKLLKTLFDDEDELVTDIEVLNWRRFPFKVFGTCCTYNYGGYDG